MNEQAIQEQYQHITTLLQQKRLKEAQSQLEAFLWNSGGWTLRNRLEQVQTSYQYMLQYTRQGINDPGQERLYRQLLADTWEIADQTRLSLLDSTSLHYYHSLRNNRERLPKEYDIAMLQKVLESFTDDMSICQLMPNNQGLDAALTRHEQTAQVLFLSTWSNSAWTAENELQSKGLLESEMLPINDLCLFTSAVMLSLMECFDARKFSWLLDATTHADTRISQRALVGIALVLHVHPTRLSLYPELTARLSLFNEDISFGKKLNRIYIQLLRSQETEKIDKKMREEIIPEMMKNVNFMRNMKFGFEDNAADENDRNPDWEKAFEQSGIGDKLREMNELQLEGADVYMSTFAQLKSYPFFKEPHNWFYPFDKQHSSVIKEFGLKPSGDNAILSLILQSGFFCNSDKYSLCFTMTHIPQAQRNMMLNQMTSQDLNELMDESKSSTLKLYAERPEVVSNQYLHDLYRFFKLSQRRHEFRDIFKEEFALHSIPVLKEILCKPDLLVAVADYHFHKEHPTEALELYQELIALNHANADIFQKTGYCLQKAKRYKEAIDAYLKADVLKPDHVWTIRHLATCYRQVRDFASALAYYKKAETIQPESHNIIFYIGSCLAEQEKYEEALKYFFKLDFIESNSIKAWRAIGWCSFISGKDEQAMKYYEKIIDFRPLATDYLNAGHVMWKAGNLDKTIELYSKAIAENNSNEKFLEMFNKDRDILLKQGIPEKDIPLVLDIVLKT